jgi:uncharacterized YceG family protein
MKRCAPFVMSAAILISVSTCIQAPSSPAPAIPAPPSVESAVVQVAAPAPVPASARPDNPAATVIALAPADQTRWRESSPSHFKFREPGFEAKGSLEFTVTRDVDGAAVPLQGALCVFAVDGPSRSAACKITLDSKGRGRIEFGLLDDELDAFTLRLEVFASDATAEPALAKFSFEFPQPVVEIPVKNGERARDLMARLAAMDLITEAAFTTAVGELTMPLGAGAAVKNGGIARLEGLISPQSYVFKKKDLPPLRLAADRDAQAERNSFFLLSDLLERSTARFERLQAARGLSPYQQAVLASIVEKEAASNTDYRAIAQVFLRRLKSGGVLGSCPTVEYALGFHRPFLLREDISIDSPYNVYVRKGLPPTPICFFSDEALEAVENPADTNYYFFVFDWTTGKLSFAATLEEHEKNANTARANYIRVFGEKLMREKRYDLFYGE